MKTNQELAQSLLKKIHDLLDPKWQSIYTARNLERMIEEHYAGVLPQWIACSERMPDIPDGKTCVKVPVTDGDDVWIEKYYERMRFLNVDDEDIARIKWQPLPQPPEEK